MLSMEDNQNYMCHICAKGILDSNFNQADIDKYQIFMKLRQISRIHKNHIFISNIGTL